MTRQADDSREVWAVIVEFVGLSCVGKSTLVTRVHEELAARGTASSRHSGRAERAPDGSMRSVPELRMDLLVGSVRSPRLALLALRLYRDARGAKLRRHLRTVGYVHRLRSVAGIHLVDEGPLKSVPKRREFDGWADMLARSVPTPDAVVHVVCDASVRVERVLRTERSHAEGLSRAQLLAIEAVTLPRLRGLLQRQGVPVLETDPTREEDAPKAVADWIVARTRTARA